MKKVQDPSWGYTLLLHYVKEGINLSYRRIKVLGKENIPTDGALIFASNHTNALMDPLVILRATGKRMVFMARADIFRKAFIKRILTFLKILPIYRIRDGFASVKQNDVIIDQAADVLASKTILALFPEGTHRPKHSLLRLSKGIFHIALETQQRIGEKQPVYIVPIGIEYGDYFRFRSTVLVQFGKPINITEALKKKESDLSEALFMGSLRQQLSEQLGKLISFVPDDADYEAIWELAKLHTAAHCPKGLKERLSMNRTTIGRLIALRARRPEEAALLFRDARAFAEERRRQQVSVYSTGHHHPLCHALLKTLRMLCLLPLYLYSAVMWWPIWLIGSFLCHRMEDKAFCNTARFGVTLGALPIILVWTTALAFVHFAWPWALLITVANLLSVSYYYDYTEQLRRLFSDWRWATRPVLREQLRKLLSRN